MAATTVVNEAARQINLPPTRRMSLTNHLRGVQDPAAKKQIEALTENLLISQGVRGNVLDQTVTFRDLYESGVAEVNIDGIFYRGDTGIAGGLMKPPNRPDRIEAPTPPRGFTVSGAFEIMILQWDQPVFNGYSFTNIYRSSTDNFGEAIKIGTSNTEFYSDNLGNAVTRYYWIRHINELSVEGPLNKTSGTSGSTAANPATILAALAGAITETELYANLQKRVHRSFSQSADPTGSFTVVEGDIWEDTTNSPEIERFRWNGSSWDAKLYDEQILKVDINGHVAGIGLSVSADDSGSAPTSNIIMLADNFAVGLPAATWLQNTAYTLGQYVKPVTVPTGFVYKCTVADTSHATTEPIWPTVLSGTVIDGGTLEWTAVNIEETVPFIVGVVGGNPAVVMSIAYIGDATITNAKIGDLAADKITAGTISAAVEMTSPTITGGLVRTATSGYRIELDNSGTIPFWYGTGTKTAANAIIHFDDAGVMTISDSLIVGDSANQHMDIDGILGEMSFVGDPGSGTDEELCRIGISTEGSDDVIVNIGSANNANRALWAQGKGAVIAEIDAPSGTGIGLRVASATTGGDTMQIQCLGANARALFVNQASGSATGSAVEVNGSSNYPAIHAINNGDVGLRGDGEVGIYAKYTGVATPPTDSAVLWLQKASTGIPTHTGQVGMLWVGNSALYFHNGTAWKTVTVT